VRFLIDENVPRPIFEWLQSQQHDVLLAGEVAAGESDTHWLELAENDQRLILTSDKDFGELIFRDQLNSHGVILLRLLDLAISARLARLQEVWSVIEANPSGRFIVVTAKRVRVRPLQ
jgi:predicted nuclease of predicted toxin-antitoxin system